MKYIIFLFKDSLYMPIIFPVHITHSQISIEGAVSVSAGFCSIELLDVRVWGRSESLNLDNGGERDSELLRYAYVYEFTNTSQYLKAFRKGEEL